MNRTQALIVAAVAVIVALFVAAYIFNPIKETGDHVVEPIGRSIGIGEGRCPEGWKDVSEEDEHMLVKSCQRDGWLVVLDQQNRFDHAVHLDTPGAVFIFDPEAVPAWPSD